MTDLDDSFFIVFVIDKVNMKNVEKSTGEVGNLNGKKYNRDAICPAKK